ncbi:transport and Golgi organization protein 11-like protein [Dinothrombium tinctorium]|nr:transport and Golgi organization protein 11-like protein [Dinothrombium tinctorium]
MATTDSPSRNVPTFDGSNLFDSEFIVEISNKMRVPEKISVLPSPDAKAARDSHFFDQKAPHLADYNWMHVPERILVVGGDKHLPSDSLIREMKMDANAAVFNDLSVAQSMPLPETLTAQHKFPSIDSETDLNSSKSHFTQKAFKKQVENGFALSSVDDVSSSEESPENETFYATINNLNQSGTSIDEVAVLRRQMKILSRRLSALEQDCQQRYQREIIIYSLGFVYFLFKGLLWLRRNW